MSVNIVLEHFWSLIVGPVHFLNEVCVQFILRTSSKRNIGSQENYSFLSPYFSNHIYKWVTLYVFIFAEILLNETMVVSSWSVGHVLKTAQISALFQIFTIFVSLIPRKMRQGRKRINITEVKNLGDDLASTHFI